MLKNLEIRVTARCNSRCLICHLWRNKQPAKDLPPAKYGKLFSHPEFKEVEDIFISGGEPFCRSDINRLVAVILKNLPKVKRFLITSNGTYPKKTLRLLKKLSKNKKITDLRLAVSLEGDIGTNLRIRGINSYPPALETLTACRRAIPGLKTRILTTLTRLNCDRASLEHLLTLAKETDSALSFRPFYDSETYHYSREKNLSLTKKQKLLVINFINKNLPFDPFLKAEAAYLKTGQSPQTDKCPAGKIFADVRPDGSVFACLNSRRKIGDVQRGIFVKKIRDLGTQESCPCCDEACFWPVYNYKNIKY